MATTATRGILGFGGQTAKETVATAFHRHKAADIDLGLIDDSRLGPPEIGGSPIPTFPYKAGYLVAGGATLYPRLEDTFGWLAYGALGAVATVTGDGVGDNPETGAYRHTFKHASDGGFLPWMSLKKFIPGDSTSNDLGEIYTDMKAVGLTFNLANDAPISARADFIGRDFTQADPSGWSWENTYESYQSIPVGCAVDGYMKVPNFSASELPIVGATVAIQNSPLDIRQEKVYGSPMLEDVTIIGRAVTYDVVLKWKDPALYRSILTGSSSGTAWTATPYVQDLDILAVSPGDISGLTQPYKLRMQSAAVMWQVNGGLRLAANQSVMMRLTGTAIEPSSGEFAELAIDNEVAAYAWPS
jgi:hypothetical protein